MAGKKVVLSVVLLVVAIALLIFMGKRSGLFGRPEAPKWVMQQLVEKIDVKTLKVVNLPLGKWDSLGHDASGRYKNPETGEYTMTAAMTCPACGEKIPAPERPPDPARAGKDAATIEREWGERNAAWEKTRAEYKCPRCGQPAIAD